MKKDIYLTTQSLYCNEEYVSCLLFHVYNIYSELLYNKEFGVEFYITLFSFYA